jgi:hypothetical protein
MRESINWMQIPAVFLTFSPSKLLNLYLFPVEDNIGSEFKMMTDLIFPIRFGL